MNFLIEIRDIEDSVNTGVLMTLVGRLINRMKTDKEKYSVGWCRVFTNTNPNSIFKRGICGLGKDGKTYFITLNPDVKAWKTVQNKKIINIIDFMQSGIERKGH